MLIHPGFHKTGTTLLQQTVFKDDRHFRTLWTHEEVDEHVVRPHDLSFDPAPAQALFRSFLDSSRPGRVDVLSSEILTGNPLLGARDSVRIAHRLEKIFGKAKVLLTVRAQRTMLASLYMQYLKAGGTQHFSRFLSPVPVPGYFGFDAIHLEYSRLAGVYAELFGSGNVLVLPQELLADDAPTFLGHVWRHSGQSFARDSVLDVPKRRIGKSPPMTAAPFYRLGNHFWRRSLNPDCLVDAPFVARSIIAVGQKQTVFFRRQREQLLDFIDRNFMGRFAGSNALLQQYCPVDLRRYDYEFPE